MLFLFDLNTNILCLNDNNCMHYNYQNIIDTKTKFVFRKYFLKHFFFLSIFFCLDKLKKKKTICWFGQHILSNYVKYTDI